VSPLADPLRFPLPLGDWLHNVGDYSSAVKNFLWHGLARETRQVYTSAQKIYESFYTLHGHTAWPASRKSLGEFIAIRATGGASIRQVKADTIQGNLATLRSIYIDCQLDTTVFDNP
jgi:hypothetical protein